MLSKLTVCISLVVMFSAAGCYDNGDKNECVGLSCPSGAQWPEGGEIRLWTIRTPDQLVIRRYFGFFISKQTPDVHNPIGAVGRCARSVDSDQGQNIEYFDVGESITFELNNGENVVVPRLLPDPNVPQCVPGFACAAGVMDYNFRIHQVAYLLETVTPADQVGDDYYNNYHTVRTANDMSFSEDLDGLYLGPSFDVTAPQWQGALTLKRGEDLTFDWLNEQVPNPDVIAVSAIVIVPDMLDPTKEPVGCLSINDGNFTIPAETIDGLSDDTGIMLVGNGANEAILTDEGRIIHKWGLFCNLIPWTRVD